MLALGLMSGTSADGVSLALVRVDGGKLRVLAHETYPYSPELSQRILAAPRASAPELCRLNFELGAVFARCAKRFMRDNRVPKGAVGAVGSHGQTVIHLPEDRLPSTLQIGEPSFLAESVGAPVVSDFRPRDMAVGGEGAPLAPFFDEYVFGGGSLRALQNLGGIGNAAFVGKGIKTFGFDTGPGNCLMDLAVRRMSNGRKVFDRDGRIALCGRIDEALAGCLLKQGFFARRPPKTLDRAAFGEQYLRRHFPAGRMRHEDAVATLTYFTALSVSDAVRRFRPKNIPLSELIVSGGGALNPALMGHLRRLLAPVPVRSISEHGIHALAKEPAMMALLAVLAVEGKINHCPAATGAREPRILGKITPACVRVKTAKKRSMSR
ncbi:MAG: anhydro-N-acetylmuramic acid kinase [Elusimicrobiota bacterium]|jgi:anhydro-N-acetylmuramic acid kinase